MACKRLAVRPRYAPQRKPALRSIYTPDPVSYGISSTPGSSDFQTSSCLADKSRDSEVVSICGGHWFQRRDPGSSSVLSCVRFVERVAVVDRDERAEFVVAVELAPRARQPREQCVDQVRCRCPGAQSLARVGARLHRRKRRLDDVGNAQMLTFAFSGSLRSGRTRRFELEWARNYTPEWTQPGVRQHPPATPRKRASCPKQSTMRKSRFMCRRHGISANTFLQVAGQVRRHGRQRRPQRALLRMKTGACARSSRI